MQISARARGIASDSLLYVFNHAISRVPSHSARNAFLTQVMNVDLGIGAAIHMGLRLHCRGQLSIGAHSVIDRDCTLDSRGHIEIGQNVNLAPEVVVLTASHDPDDAESFGAYVLPVSIEDYAWVATRAVILPGVRIGAGAVVAAGSVVTADVSPGEIVGGNPARTIRARKGLPRYELNYRRLLH
jgi:acetyltransferase-like isoleucine patch superfamily enzyme